MVITAKVEVKWHKNILHIQLAPGGRPHSEFSEIKMGDLASPYEDADTERGVGPRMMQAQLEADETR